ncbi:hypothetical protein GCM10029978_068440 [Actinoallomurus acanthiterrae]
MADTSHSPASGTATKTATAMAWTTAGLLQIGLWLTAPALAALVTVLEAALTITVILTALYAPKRISDRAFRMLPWTASTPTRPRSTGRTPPSNRS